MLGKITALVAAAICAGFVVTLVPGSVPEVAASAVATQCPTIGRDDGNGAGPSISLSVVVKAGSFVIRPAFYADGSAGVAVGMPI